MTRSFKFNGSAFSVQYIPGRGNSKIKKPYLSRRLISKFLNVLLLWISVNF
jgi:hypothetical protein